MGLTKGSRWRLAFVLLLILALAPGTWVRSRAVPPDSKAPMAFTRLALPDHTAKEVTLIAAWQLASTNDHFGGYSALVAVDADKLIAASDRGRILRLDLADPAVPKATMQFLAGNIQPTKRLIDVESMTRDPGSGQFWIGYEGVNAIERLDPELANPVRVRPSHMRDWPSNQGPESIVRLADGRFIVLAEGDPDTPWLQWFRRAEDFPALRFAQDPVEGGAALPFRISAPKGYRPVDMVQIPDGRVLVLFRQVHMALPPRFTAKIMVLDPSDIDRKSVWTGRIIADIAPPLPSDNYEGLAVRTRSDGQLDLWLIADDNLAAFQRTLLLKMLWDPLGKGKQTKEKARSPAARLSIPGQ